MLSDALMMMDDFRHNEAEELLGEHRIEPALLRQGTQAGDLLVFPCGVGGVEWRDFRQAHRQRQP